MLWLRDRELLATGAGSKRIPYAARMRVNASWCSGNWDQHRVWGAVQIWIGLEQDMLSDGVTL